MSSRPARRCAAGHAGRARGPAATPWGENSEALFLTSCFVHPDAATAARRFANEEDAFVYSRFSNPTSR
jgi:O-succinylhomoserine sulfhydrylase